MINYRVLRVLMCQLNQNGSLKMAKFELIARKRFLKIIAKPFNLALGKAPGPGVVLGNCRF